MSGVIQRLVNPDHLHSFDDIHREDARVPSSPGLYGWYFDEIPELVSVGDCVKLEGKVLLYVGVAPSEPSRAGKVSRETLRSRIRMHYGGNAFGSTLRLSLGCLLSDRLGLELRRVGGGRRMTFTRVGEGRLSEWMRMHAFVTWVEHVRPWKLEKELLGKLSLPLNLKENEGHPFHETLSRLRRIARQRAEELPVAES